MTQAERKEKVTSESAIGAEVAVTHGTGTTITESIKTSTMKTLGKGSMKTRGEPEALRSTKRKRSPSTDEKW